jgi:hypothetical protein
METLVEYIFFPALSYLFLFFPTGPFAIIIYIMFIPKVMKTIRKRFHSFKFRIISQILLGFLFLWFGLLVELFRLHTSSGVLDALFKSWILILAFSFLLLKAKEGSKFETFQMALVSFFAVAFLNLIIVGIVIKVFGIMWTV